MQSMDSVVVYWDVKDSCHQKCREKKQILKLLYYEQLSATLIIIIITRNVQISILPNKIVATYHRSNPHIDSTPHPDLLLEAQPF